MHFANYDLKPAFLDIFNRMQPGAFAKDAPADTEKIKRLLLPSEDLFIDDHSTRNQVAGVKKAPSKPSVAHKAAKRIQTTNEKTFYCSACDKAFPNQYSLARYEATKLHEKRLSKESDSISP
ncbi:MAG: hypothetical protein Q9223_003879 [Gallowayella weberi]